MPKFEDSVACPVCHKVVAWDIFHKHWKHAKGHATAQNPIPPSWIQPSARIPVAPPPPESTQPTINAAPIHEEGGFGETIQDFGADVEDGAGGPVAMQELLPGDRSSTVKFGNNAGTSMTDFKINWPGQPTLLGNHYVHPQSAARSALKVQQASNHYYPFNSSDQKQLARDLSWPVLLTKDRIIQIGVRSKRSYLHRSPIPFDSYEDFMGRMDELVRTQSFWEPRKFSDKTMSYPWSGGVKFYARDSLAVLQEILENRALADKCIWEPERVTNGDGERVYTDMHDSEFWWKTQVDTTLGK